MKIREIIEADHAKVNTLYRQLYPDTTTEIDLSARSFSAKYLPLVIESEEKILGIGLGVIFQYGQSRLAYLEDLVIAKTSRGMGLGRALVEHFLRECASLRVEAVFIATDFDNEDESPVPFYESLGFRKTRSPWLVKGL
jgi:ribosomal protein S18 acetylase RimI-like enzyme